ncbi:NAD-dependent epimerase/dehydratase family protein [Frateuria aurantia]|uniref:NAD-dependent epimerase/dehydratase family protein n=1 Tax=Frateuria aurantia TaxID=81475 RepID=UPI0002463E78|nr:NAD-dependent epimerase/dehydratase family protein [Frateuria aurantia]
MDSYRHASSLDPARPVLLAGCGDLGLRVAASLQARQQPALGLRRSPPAGPSSPAWIQADLCRPETLTALPRSIDTVMYSPTPGARDPARYHAVFVEGLGHLLDRLQGHDLRRVVLVSSTAVYGDLDGEWGDESTVTEPLGFNGRVLLEAEQLLQRRCPQAGVVVRLGGIYGPGRLQWLRRLQQGHVRVPRQRPHWSNRIHADDAAALLLQLLQVAEPAPLYLGVDGQPLRLDHFYDAMAVELGLPPPAEGPAPTGIGNKRLASARLAALGFRPRWPDAIHGCRALLANID